MANRNIIEDQKDIVNTFIFSWINEIKPSQILHLTFKDSIGAFELSKDLRVDNFLLENSKSFENKKWDLVLGDLASKKPKKDIGDRDENFDDIDRIENALNYISDSGEGIFCISERSLQNSKFEKRIKDLGYTIVGFINPPTAYFHNLAYPETPYDDESLHKQSIGISSRVKIQAITRNLQKWSDSLDIDGMKTIMWLIDHFHTFFIVVKKGIADKQFIATLLSPEDAKITPVNYVNKRDGQFPSHGLFIDEGQFRGFEKWKLDHQIFSLDTTYNKFQKIRLDQVTEAIKICKVGESFTSFTNCTYLPLIGNSEAVGSIEETKIKHQNYIQLVCDPNIVDSYYLAAFFNSTLGKLIKQSHTRNAFIPRLSKKDVVEMEIALPELKVQKEIVQSIKKLKMIRGKISLFEDNFSINPINPSVNRKIDLILEAVDELDDADKIKSIIREGESKTVEFKQTFNLDVKSQKESVNNFLVTASIKTIAAFLNTDGGTLLIGVADNGEVTGIDEEVERLNGNIPDKFLLHFKNFIHHRIGAEFYPYIDQKIVEVDEKKVLFVTCKQSEKEVFVDGKDFYVRSNPSTDKLEGSKLLDYIKNHFKLKGS